VDHGLEEVHMGRDESGVGQLRLSPPGSNQSNTALMAWAWSREVPHGLALCSRAGSNAPRR